MQVKTKAIVISAIKYQEKSLIVKCFTESDGLKSYFVRDAFSAKKSAQKTAYFQPLTILEIEAVHKNKGTLEYFKDIRVSNPFHSVHSNIYKSTIVMFISEVLHYAIHEEEKNELLFTFLETALHWLDNHDDISNFHLILMLEASKYLGFYPDISNIDLKYFEMMEGIFTPFQGTTALDEQQSSLFKKLIGLRFENGEKNFNINQRHLLLKILVDYYSLHLEGFKKPNSLDILKEVFS